MFNFKLMECECFTRCHIKEVEMLRYIDIIITINRPTWIGTEQFKLFQQYPTQMFAEFLFGGVHFTGTPVRVSQVSLAQC